MDKVRELLHIIYEMVIKPLLRELVRRLKDRAWDFLKPLLKMLGVYFFKALGIVCLIVLAPLILLMLAVRCGAPSRKKSPEDAMNDIVEDVDEMDAMMDDMGLMGWPQGTVSEDTEEE